MRHGHGLMCELAAMRDGGYRISARAPERGYPWVFGCNVKISCNRTKSPDRRPAAGTPAVPQPPLTMRSRTRTRTRGLTSLSHLTAAYTILSQASQPPHSILSQASHHPHRPGCPPRYEAHLSLASCTHGPAKAATFGWYLIGQ